MAQKTSKNRESKPAPRPSFVANESHEGDDSDREDTDAESSDTELAEVVPEVIEDVTLVDDSDDSSDDSSAISRYDPMQAYLQEVQRHPLLSDEEEQSLATDYFATGNVRAAHRLVTANLRLVVKIAYEYRRAYKNIMDLVARGQCRPDASREEIRSYARREALVVCGVLDSSLYFALHFEQLAHGKNRDHPGAAKTFLQFEQRKAAAFGDGDRPDSRSIGGSPRCRAKEVVEMEIRLGASEASLDAPVAEGDGRSAPRVDFIDAGNQPVDVVLAEAEMTQNLRDKLATFRATLHGKELDIFEKRLASTEEPLTLQELGDHFGFRANACASSKPAFWANCANISVKTSCRTLNPRMTDSGTLYVVATPIGNLEDITERAKRVLALVDAIFAEDTRHTIKLLTHLGIRKPLHALHAHSGEETLHHACERLKNGAIFALVSDAGTPLVSDPGAELVRKALDLGVSVVAVPGPSAILCALVASGFGGQGFRFFGFLPRGGHARSAIVVSIAETPEPVVLYESPQRTAATLAEFAQLAPDRPAAVCREMTKIHEQTIRGTIATLAQTLESAEIRGEVTIVLGPKPAIADTVDDSNALAEFIVNALDQGCSVRDLADIAAAKFGRKKSDVYAMVVAQKSKPH